MSSPALKDDILHGANAIADFLGLGRRVIYHLVSKGLMPTFRLGETVCARKSTLLKWIEDQERTTNV